MLLIEKSQRTLQAHFIFANAPSQRRKNKKSLQSSTQVKIELKNFSHPQKKLKTQPHSANTNRNRFECN
jgi:hypothetical protein